MRCQGDDCPLSLQALQKPGSPRVGGWGGEGTFVGFSLKLAVCLALSRETGAPLSVPACCFVRPWPGETCIQKSSPGSAFRPLSSPVQRRVVVTGGPVAQYVQASPACSSPLASEVRHSQPVPSPTHTTAILTHSSEQSLHTPVIDHIAHFCF